jgi:hypothetical protein
MRTVLFLVCLMIGVNACSQVLSSVSYKVGLSYAGQIKSPALAQDGPEKPCISFTIEPTLESFGNKNKFHLHLALTYAQKGSIITSPVYAYNQLGQIVAEGSETYSVSQNYFVIAPTISFDYGERFYAKIGPRLDVFTGFRSGAQFSSDKRKKEDFEKYNLGATLALGYVGGSNEDHSQFMFEIVGQPDFSPSSSNLATGQSLTNFAFLFNIGFRVNLVPAVSTATSKN